MTKHALPLFFPEALQDYKTLTPRLRALSLTLDDLSWLRNVELANHAQRSSQTSPMTVETLLIEVTGEDPTPLAGSFLMHPAPGGNQAILYSPYGGLEKFDDRQRLLTTLQTRLKDAKARVDLLAFLGISRRATLKAETALTLTGEVIEGLVFDVQAALLEQSHGDNVADMLAQLEQLPTLTSMLDQLNNSALNPLMSGMEQADSRVTYSTPQLPSERLSDAVLSEYLHQPWAKPAVRRYSNPRPLPASDTPTQQHVWEQALKRTAADLPASLENGLQGFWTAAVSDGVDRRQFFAQAMADKARTDLLRKRQDAIISPAQSLALCERLGLSHSSAATGSALGQAQKIRLWENRENYLELAGSLMLIDDDAAFLYTQPNGLQVLDSLADLKQALAAMVTTGGHDDQLFSLLALREKALFLGFDQPEASQASMATAVFTGMLDDIIAKQKDNVRYALDTWRNTQGAFDLPAFFDQALDVRGLIDSQLLTGAASDRWKVLPGGARDHRSSIILAMQAALAIKQFQAPQSALDLKAAAQPASTAQQQKAFLESIKPDLAHAMSVGIRGEARLRVLSKTLRADEKAIVDCVLNPDKPTRAQRHLLNGVRPDAWALTLKWADTPALIPVANCLLLTERGGEDSATAGRALLWTPKMGLESFSSLDTAKEALRQRLADPLKRQVLLENLLRSDYHLHGAYRLGGLRLIESNVLEDRQQSAIELLLDARAHTRALKRAADLTLAELETYPQVTTALNLQRASAIAQAIVTRHGLPHWLASTHHAALKQHVELLEQVRSSTDDGLDYLEGIDPLLVHARTQLRASLNSRFSRTDLDPDQIWLTPTPVGSLPAQSLTEFALNPLETIEKTQFGITSTQSVPLPAELNLSEVRRLVLQLDIKSAYRKLLGEKLLGTAPEVATRRQRFVRQLPWQLLLHAHSLKLQGKLSARGYNLLQQVLDMPDAVARAAVNGASASVQPLELTASEGQTVIKVPGVYRVSDASNAVQVLYAPYETELAITEYTDPLALLSALKATGPLQALVLRRLQEPDRANCRKLLAEHAAQVLRLGSQPIGGNLLLQLFDDNQRLLERMLGSQSGPAEHVDWQTVVALFSKGIRFAGRFLPGKLAIPVILEQSYSAFKQSAEALQDHHWKTALYSFINGVSQLLTMGSILPESEAPDLTGEVSAEAAPLDITAALRTQLQSFEASGVELAKIGAASLQGQYTDSRTGHRYVPVKGKVYRIEHKSRTPRVVAGDQLGPFLQRDGRQWALDPDQHTVHFGKALSTLRDRYTTVTEVRQYLNVEARGMEAIERLYPERAWQIQLSLAMARDYAFHSVHNLVLLSSGIGNPRLDTFLRSFFDVAFVDRAMIRKIKAAIVPLCQALMDPGLDQLDQKRFVVGSGRLPEQGVIAFVVTEDKLQHVHFTELFFNPGLDEYKGKMTERFDIVTHSQAATLIHEFSHLYSKTWDFANLESRRPFSDLISDADKRTDLEAFQRNALSLATPRHRLFTVPGDEEDVWVDYDQFSFLDKLTDAVSEATGGHTMSEARAAFLNPLSADRRIDTILRNADSVARMICEMGRKLDAVPANPAVPTVPAR